MASSLPAWTLKENIKANNAREPEIDYPSRVHIFTVALLSYLVTGLSNALNHCVHVSCKKSSVRDGENAETSPKFAEN